MSLTSLSSGRTALIGATGFVGTSLRRQATFSEHFNSRNISEIEGQTFDLIVCCGLPAKKWIANQAPDADLANMQQLQRHLEKVQAHRFILISTVDVFVDPVGVDESTRPASDGLHPYGAHRLMFEAFCADQFSGTQIVRLPGLVGPGLQKNVIFDFLNNNNLDQIDSRAVFQFYPMVQLVRDLEITMALDCELIHLTAAPVSVATLARDAFGMDFRNELDARAPAAYDFRTAYAHKFGGEGGYQYSVQASLVAARCYALTEPPRESEVTK